LDSRGRNKTVQKILVARLADEDNKLIFEKTAASFQNNYI